MTDPGTQFAIELGRAAKKAHRWLRRLPLQDRDDAIASAMLSCWERRSTFDPLQEALEDWFARSVRSSAQYIVRATRVKEYASVKLGEIPTLDESSRTAEALDSTANVLKNLTATEQTIALELAEGYNLKEIAERLSLSRGIVRATLRKVKRMKAFRPNVDPVFQAYAALEPFDRELAPIDHAIEAMLRRPATERADCPPCWKCMYFEGWKPVHYKPSKIVDEEIRIAVHSTEGRKIEIAGSRS